MDYQVRYLKYKAKYLKNRASQMHGGTPAANRVHAICTIIGDKLYDKDTVIQGTIYLDEMDDGNTKIYGKIMGLPDGDHGFHIHESADMTKCCASLGGHYNPFGKDHGAPTIKDANENIITNPNRHVGDLGNLTVENNEVTFEMIDTLVKLSGKYSVIGRSLIIHKDIDDLGKGGKDDSLITGHAGARIACGIIGYK